jgi:hypothetical protein
MSKVILESLADMPVPNLDRDDFGHWTRNRSNNTLEYRDDQGRFRYYVDFDRCRTSAQVLDWIFQIHQKTWCSAQDLKDLLKAIRYVINPQARLCSFAMSKTPNSSQ